jgi:hypothetical protein
MAYGLIARLVAAVMSDDELRAAYVTDPRQLIKE